MRRLWAFILAGAAIAFAADLADAQVRIGAKGGITFSDISFDPDDGTPTEFLLGFAGGGEVQIPLGASGVSVQGEVLYLRKGVKFAETGFDEKVKVDYIEIPVLLRYNIPAASVTPFLYAGGAVSFEASCSAEGSDGSITIDADCEDPAVDIQTESTDFSVLFGGGIAFPAGPGDLFVEGRYSIGLVDVDALDGLEAKNRSGAVMLGYSVSLDPTSR